jgi:hypothetical protein
VVVWADVGAHAAHWGNCPDAHPHLRLWAVFAELIKEYLDCPRVDLGAVPVRQLCNESETTTRKYFRGPLAVFLDGRSPLIQPSMSV